jgi:hypothetical protein
MDKAYFSTVTQFRPDWQDLEGQISVSHAPSYSEEQEREIVYESKDKKPEQEQE